MESLVTKAGGKITVLDRQDTKTCEQELAEDLLSIIHIFSCRQNGRRNYQTKNRSDQDLSKQGSTETS
jgi:putative resolvase